MKRATCLGVVLGAILLTSGASAAPGSKEAQGKLSSELYRIALAAEPRESRPAQSTQTPGAAPPSVTVVAELVAKPDIPGLSAFIIAQGGAVLGQNMGLLKFSLPATSLVAVSQHASIVHLRKPFTPSPKRKSSGGAANESGQVVSQGRAVIHADAFSANTGAQGAGVRVGVLDSFEGVNGLLGNELPGDVEQAGLLNADGVHGSACAEIIHDVAPDAKLVLASFADEVEWGMALDRLVGAGVKIISHSIGFDNIYPPNGVHPFAAKVDAVAAAGVLFVSAAGNEGGNYFQGPWQDTNNNEFLEFGDRTEFLPIGGGEVTARLRWDDSYGAAAHDYDLYIVSGAFRDNPDPSFPESDKRILARSEDLQNNSGNPLESLSFESKDEIVYAVIHHDPGTPRSSSQRFWLWTSGGVQPEFFAPAGSLSLPADARGALTVGAMGWSNLVVEGFSSRGPTSDGRTKPDLAGPDGVATASYKGDPFYGTSAATPHAAGAAALLLSRTPNLSLSDLRSALERATTSGGGSKNNDTGAGLIDLLR